MNPLERLTSLGQSLWLDNIRRSSLESGEIRELIDRGDIRGMTANPTIFNQAITRSSDYDEAIRCLAWSGRDAENIFWELAVEDVRLALDHFAALYEQTNGADGYVSIEVDPHLAHDTEGTIAQAQQLWARIARPNLMVKIPASVAGIPAVRQSVAAGLNINITLIFSQIRYAQVMDAYLSGLEDRLAQGRSLDHIASVASFFVSRIDSKVDQRLPVDSPLRGRIAIANAKLAYENFRKTFSGDRWERLRLHGARLQRPLWASTSTKDPSYPDTLYVDELAGPDTVNTLPPQTLDAARDHARGEETITQGVDAAVEALAALETSGISMDQVAAELEREGIESFGKSIDDLFETIDTRRGVAQQSLGPLSDSVAKRIDALAAGSFLERFCSRDPALWSSDPEGRAEASRRMGWLDAPQRGRASVSRYREFAADISAAGISRFLVVGMGGSSLATEVLSSAFSKADASDSAAVCLGILDSTDPGQVAQAVTDFPPEKSLYIISSKSGSTSEVMAAFDLLWSRANSDASRFVAITDSGTSLEKLARDLGFRRVFTADETVGGRFSALTDFGLVPAALLGVDLERLLARAEWMQSQCGSEMPVARSSGIALGAVLGEAARAGRDKLTLLADTTLRAMPHWIEQLVAESSGKQGKGILPVVLEPLDDPALYGKDRLFVYLRQNGALDSGVQALSFAGHPVLTFDIPDAYALGAEFYRWEVAVATACHILGVNAFDQPDVQESKDRTRAKIEEFRVERRLREGSWDVHIGAEVMATASRARLHSFLASGRPGDYVAINAYLPRRQGLIDELQRIRAAIREQTGLPVTAGFGPRFQHSTGQLHKGGPNNGLFLQVVCDTANDIDIPGQGMTFGTLIRAQALGDYETLVARGRRVLRVHLSNAEGIVRLRKVLSLPNCRR